MKIWDLCKICRFKSKSPNEDPCRFCSLERDTPSNHSPGQGQKCPKCGSTNTISSGLRDGEVFGRCYDCQNKWHD